MSPEGYARKRNFVRRDLGRFVCGLFLEVSALDFRIQDDDSLTCGKEQVKISLRNGNLIFVDVTGMDLLETTRAVLDVLAGGTEAEP